uniref:Uncharacterized protein n=1 Tax=Helianthus annuus TaxID=4232 RepID=A0A251VR00_HELAN
MCKKQFYIFCFGPQHLSTTTSSSSSRRCLRRWVFSVTRYKIYGFHLRVKIGASMLLSFVVVADNYSPVKQSDIGGTASSLPVS